MNQWNALIIGAVAVNAPRLIIGFLRADGIHIDPALEWLLTSFSAVGTALVLTFGNLQLAHVVGDARMETWRRIVAVVAWALLLLLTTVVLTPLVVMATQAHALATVLRDGALWLWCAVAVVSVEIIIGAAAIVRDGAAAACETRADTETITRANDAPNVTHAQTTQPAYVPARADAYAAESVQDARATENVPHAPTPPPSTYPRACTCGYVARNAQAYARHARDCGHARASKNEPRAALRVLHADTGD